MKKTIVAAALGECVHVAGIYNFLHLAESAGWKTVFLGPAVPVNKVIEIAEKEDAELVGVSYRLTPETGERLLADFAEAADELRQKGVRFAFGGTPPVAERAEKLGFFEKIFSGGEPADEILAYLKGQSPHPSGENDFPQTLIERIRWKSPYPLLRHHFGLPIIEATRTGIEQIAQSRVLDVVSLGIDQDAQENFFHPERQDPRRKGAGGVPVRSAEDYQALYEASRQGNFPLMRTYSGTDDFIRLAETVTASIHNAWCAIPLFWFNRMDGRGPWDLEGSIREHQRVMNWYGTRGIPVELNEPHHWGMRDAPDVICVVSAFLSAYNARANGVTEYIAQLMFNSPQGLSDAMDLAKMLTIMKLIEPLEANNFHILRQTRTGLLSYPLERSAARSHLAVSVYLQMALRPHVVHVVGYTEADHAASAEDVIESCLLARKAIDHALTGAPEMISDAIVQRRAAELEREALVTLDAIHSMGTGGEDAFTDPSVLTRAVKVGILDAPQLQNNPFAPGRVRTRIIDGKCLAVDATGNPLTETKRLEMLDLYGKESK